ncbi:MAG: hypothetical protein EOP84_04890 [Verrucomicrobiaceae bacterium]|nr:MAG: hypothetical protein EOP84_04890 [Verrucomicrobiaceae bacterium]
MDDIVTNAAIREQKAIRRNGSQAPHCRVCGENHPACLEQHHIAGRANHDETHSICRNCHRKLSDQQLDHPPAIVESPSFAETVGNYLLGLADMLRLIAESLVAFGKGLIAPAHAHAPAEATR